MSCIADNICLLNSNSIQYAALFTIFVIINLIIAHSLCVISNYETHVAGAQVSTLKLLHCVSLTGTDPIDRQALRL